MLRERMKKADKENFFLKKVAKSFGGSEKSSTFASAIERDALRKEINAEIAQLVEHNLAKVGVAGPSPVFRSTYCHKKRDFTKV